MSIATHVFKAYDIRGLVDGELTEELAYYIGHAYLQVLKEKGFDIDGKKLVVGYDMRETSIAFKNQIAKAWQQAGVDVVDVGLSTTPTCNFAAAHYDDHVGAIMITASHNPSEYNGFKLVMQDGLPIGKHNGMDRIKELVVEQFVHKAQQEGSLEQKNIMDDYLAHVFSLVSASSMGSKKIVIDYGNGIGSVAMKLFLAKLPQIEVISMYEKPDGSFPNHEANPLKLDTLIALQDKVKEVQADFGIALDGDADRIGLVDNNGEIVEASFVGALYGLEVLRKNPKSHMLYDLRSSQSVKELWEAAGATTGKSVVGHALIKKMMKDNDAVFASELSLHLYFKDMYGVESSEYALGLLLAILAREEKSVSELVSPMKKYFHSGELNFEVDDKAAAIARVQQAFGDSANEHSDLDGLWLGFDWGWFNIRQSNTEPVLRLNLEAWSEKEMGEKVEEVKKMIMSN